MVPYGLPGLVGMSLPAPNPLPSLVDRRGEGPLGRWGLEPVNSMTPAGSLPRGLRSKERT